MSIKTIFKYGTVLALLMALALFFKGLKNENTALYNALAAADTLHKIDSVRYSQLSFQYDNLDSIKSGIILEKDREIQSLAHLKGKVELKIDTVWAEKKSKDDSLYWFWKNTDEYSITGKVKFIDSTWYAIIMIDTMIIPIKLDIAYIRHTVDGQIELQVNTNNKYIVIDEMTSYIKVPPINNGFNKKYEFFAGPVIGSSWGVLGGARYKNWYLF